MLTETRVKTAKPRQKAYKLADSARLFLLVAPGGGKPWRWNYDYDGRAKTMALGAWPLVSLADARSRQTAKFGPKWKDLWKANGRS